MKLFNLVPNSVYDTRFGYADLAVKTPADKSLNSGVEIYLSWLSSSFLSISITFVS